MGEDLLALGGVLLGTDQAALYQVLQLLESRLGGGGGRDRGVSPGWGLATDVVAETLRPRDRGKDDHPLLRRRFDDHGSKAQHPAKDSLLDGDVLDLLERGLLDLAGDHSDLPDDPAAGHDELVEVGAEAE